ncbi:TetR/AcrR family transcriptional regulator [Plantactinospora sp. ZYX-F-223]|uniref:TetR/AcrR family transcriptional regulator n=1 Tax=Plantactinospora sp. ZYX-F-223 TaxID=3144103 RepID=UPI0031FDC70D
MEGKPIGDRRAERHQETKAEIIQAAWDLTQSQGLAGLSLRDLAARVRMRPQSLYSYFPSKHAIYDAMFANGYRQFLEAMAQVAPSVDPRAGLKTTARAYLAFCVADNARYQLLFQRPIPGFEPSAESYALAPEALAGGRLPSQWTENLARLGVSDPADIDISTALVTGLVDQQIANDPGGDRWARHLDDVVDMFVDHATRRPAPAAPRKKRGAGPTPRGQAAPAQTERPTATKGDDR